MERGGYRDYFKVLEVERTASPEEIKRSFRKLAREYHPDVNPNNSQAEARFKEISEAYEVLSDPDKRRKYEQFGQYWNQTENSYSKGTGGFDVDFGRYGDFDDFINDLLGRFGGPRGSGGFPGAANFSRTSANSSLALDAEVLIKLSFAEAFKGTQRILSVNEERVQVTIPEGVKSGTRLRLKGKGNLQPGTGKRGDLYLNLEVTPHAIWHFEGNKLCADLPVSFDELALGSKITTITPDGEAELTIPAGTLPGKRLKLKGKGWPSPVGRGDLLLTLTISFPDQWSFDEIQLLENFSRIRSHHPRKGWLHSARI